MRKFTRFVARVNLNDVCQRGPDSFGFSAADKSGFGTLFRRYWLPWFQPQHQHFVSYPNLRKILEERGFSLVKVHRSEAHIRVDVSAAVYLFLEHLAPAPERPWLPRRGAAARALRMLTFLLGTPLIVTGILLDNTLARLYVSATIGNAFRVLARKGPEDATPPT